MSSSDEEQKKLDLTSPNFDPLAALNAPNNKVKLLNPGAPIFDNMTWFIETENGIFPRERIVKQSSKKPNQNIPAATSSTTSLSQDSMQSKAGTKPKNKFNNILTRMDRAVGPLGFLKKCMDEKKRVKVYIRSAASIRGFCLGFIEAFDKHMNMVLKDVFETWKRPRKKHGLNLEPVQECENYDNEDESQSKSSSSKILHKCGEKDLKGNTLQETRYRIPRWIVKRRLKKKDLCERHIDQLMIRGEQIVTVMLENSCMSE